VPLQANVDGTITGASPTFVNDTDTIKYVKPAGTHVPALNNTVLVGGTFDIDADTKTLLANGIDLSTADPVKFTCDAASNCKTTGAGIIVVIDATDATTFTGPTDLGKATAKSASLTCAAFSDTVSIPAGAFAVLKQANPKRMRISIFHDYLTPDGTVNVVAGHGLIKFQNF
jgi:hypothetical protein